MILYDDVEKENRFRLIRTFLKNVKDKTILDIGGNDGFMSLDLLNRGAKLAHVFDIIPEEYALEHPNLIYRSTDICSWDEFEEEHKDILLPSYDIVMFLGTYHHLCEEGRYSIFRKSMEMVKKYYCFRCRRTFFKDLKYEVPSEWKKKGKFVWQIS